MFERYTEQARRLLFFARYEASQLGHRAIEPEHLLLGLLREGKGAAHAVLDALDREAIRAEIQQRHPQEAIVPTSVEIPFSPDTKRALRTAAEEADRRLDLHIGSEHLLLGLLREEHTLAVTILRSRGIDLDALRDRIASMSCQERAREARNHRGALDDGAGSEEAVRALHRSLLDRWNARDAAGIAALYAAHGYQVGFDGTEIDGPAAIERHLAEVFAHHQTAAYVGKVRTIHVFGDAAVLRAAVGMVPPGQDDLNPAANAIQTLVAARRDGAWKVQAFHNTPAAFHGRPEASAQLTDELREVLRSQPPRAS